MTTFDGFSTDELATIHHALRLLSRYEDERAESSRLADQAWSSLQLRYHATADETSGPTTGTTVGAHT